ncbi:uncharacterized protein LOC130674065 [Microplitis mediator]|uniref:uncharacterized protein LOC130674065 n=1 Tax=Microplitis mediator TaxID=375433 RepID=UPI002555E10E|nr:uncharacterized protein LOC130674065 [Microplitis mediator]XP_057335349.1 uncharacterized protein LOC130674065 [Microplitis mediator]
MIKNCLKNKIIFIRNLYKNRKRIFIVIQFIMFRAIGLSPWTFNYSSELLSDDKAIGFENITYCLSLWGSTYNIVFGVVLMSANGYSFSCLLKKGLIINSIVLKDTEIVLQCVSFALISFIVIRNFFIQMIAINFFNKLQSIDRKLNKMSVYKLKNGHSNQMFLFNFFLSAIFIVMRMIEINLQNYMTIISTILSNVFYNLIILQCITMLNLIVRRIDSLNLSISKMENSDSDSDTNLKIESIKRKIYCLKEANVDLCKLFDDVMSFCLVPILIAVTYVSSLAIFTLYYIVFTLSRHAKIFDSVQYKFYVIWLIWMTVLIFLVIINFNRINKQKKKAENILDLRSKQYAMDREIEHEIMELSQDRLNREVEVNCDSIQLDLF